MAIHRYEPGDTIINFGDKSTDFHFLIQGSIEVISEFGSLCDTTHAPSFFGEVGILEKVPRIANIRAKTYCVTCSLSESEFKTFYAKFPPIATAIKETSNKRMQSYLERNVLA